MAERSLLLVDGDSRRRRALEVGLRRAGFRVTVAGSPEQALWFLDHAVPGAIVSSASFPEDHDGGVSLAEVVRSRSGCSEVAFVMMLDDGVGEAVLPTALADDVLVHAPTVAELVERLDRALHRREIARLLAGETRELRGDLRDVTPIDLLALIERVGESGTLTVGLGDHTSTLWFAQGRITDAVCGRFEGEDAVFRLLLHESGAFELKLGPVVRGEVIRASMSSLVGESLRRLDEWMRLCEEVPLETHLWVDHELLAARRATLGAEQLALIRGCDGRRSVREIVEESGRDLLLALEALRNLRVDGVLVDHPEPSAAPTEELPPLPAFPEPFPGIASDAEVDVDAPLVSGIPDEHPDDAGASGRFAGEERDGSYVFRPPVREAGTLAERFREVSERESGIIGRAIADAIGGAGPGQRTPWRIPSRPTLRAEASPGDASEGEASAGEAMAKVAEVSEPAANTGLAAADEVKAAEVAEAAEEVEVAEATAVEAPAPITGPAEVLREALVAQAEEAIARETARGIAREDRTTLPDMLVPAELLDAPKPAEDDSTWAPPAQEGPSFDEWEAFAADESDTQPAAAPKPSPTPPLNEDDEPTQVAKVLPLLRERRLQRRSVRVPAINGAVSPPKGLTRAESAGEIVGESQELARVSSAEAAMSSASQRPSILVHLSGVPHVSGAHPVFARTTAATPSGLIAGEIVDDPGDSPAERSANLLLLTESRDDFGRLNAMAGMFSSVTSRHAVVLPPPLPPPTGYQAPPAVIDEDEIRLPSRFSARTIALLLVIAVAASAWIFRDRLRPGGGAPPAPETPSGPPVVISAMNPPGEAAAPSGSAGEDRPAGASPEEIEAIVAEAERLYRRGAVEASFEVARALARDPKNGPALVLRAKIALERGDLPAAREAADVAVAEHPELAEAHLTSAVVHEEQGAAADAIAAYKRYLELAPDSRYASGVRRKIYRLRRKLSE